MRYVLCYPNSKQPIGHNWPSHTLTADQVAERRANNPALNIGALLGPESGIIDVECDSSEATEAYARLLGHIPAPCWQSTRGRHYLYRYDERLAPLGAVAKLDHIEFRLGGGGKAAQSICPPSTVDGVTREWIVSPDDCPLSPLPDEFVEALLAQPRAAGKRKPGIDLPRTQRLTRQTQICRYLDRCGLSIAEIREAHERITIDLSQCPFRHPDHDEGGAAILIYPDGGYDFHCFHPNCADKHFSDLEALYGPLIPSIRLGADLHRNTQEVIAALGDDPGIYQRAGLTEIVHDAEKPPLCLSDDGSPQIRPITAPTLKRRASAVAKIEKYDARKKDWKRTILPPDLAASVLSASEFPGIPVITGVTSGPALRADGSIVNQPGYDPQTGLYLDVEDGFPAMPSVDEAIASLRDVLCDFPFADVSHESAAIAGIVTMVCRPAIAGTCPLFLVDANNTRVGKGLLTDVMCLIAYGRRAARYDYRPGEELAKTVTSVAMAGIPYLCFDNVKDMLGGAALENALTATRWSARILGQNKQVELPLQIVWLATGNNCEITEDMLGRICHIRLDSMLENPSERTGFRYPHLLSTVEKCRKVLAMAALAIPARFIAAGRPDQGLKPFGGFEAWSDLVRQSIVWAGLPDPLASRPQVSSETDLAALLVDGWGEIGKPATVSAALKLLDESEMTTEYAMLREAVTQLTGNGSRSHRLGQALRTYRGRVVSGKMLVRSEHKVPQWSVAAVG